jgi:hypothetical protein
MDKIRLKAKERDAQAPQPARNIIKAVRHQHGLHSRTYALYVHVHAKKVQGV